MKKRNAHKPAKLSAAKKPQKSTRSLVKLRHTAAPIPAHRVNLLPYTMEFHPEL